LEQTFERQVQRRREQLVACDRLRETLGYRETLRRGYAVVRSGQALITNVASAGAAKSLEIEFADGRFSVAQTAAARPAGRAKPKPPEQGQLF
jgi:exodeoxyribonuclease VII large subunit